MNRLLLAFMALVVSGAVESAAAAVPFAAKASARPNVLLIVGDDIGLGDTGPYGSEIKTPNLNALAAEGVRFTNSHVSPVCSVTRGELLTGNNNIEVGLGTFDYLVYGPSKGKPG